jgi:hypothetical protein
MSWGLALAMALALALMGWPSRAQALDPITQPPDFEARSSPSGRYLLEVALRPHANPHAARATASLWETRAGARTRVWTRELAHRPRPRFFLVGDEGQVVLLDEWLNLRSPLAVVVIDKTQRTLAVHDLEAVRAALDVPIGALAPRARHGAWMQAPPTLSAGASAVEVAAAGRLLLIRLHDGALSRR